MKMRATDTAVFWHKVHAKTFTVYDL